MKIHQRWYILFWNLYQLLSNNAIKMQILNGLEDNIFLKGKYSQKNLSQSMSWQRIDKSDSWKNSWVWEYFLSFGFISPHFPTSSPSGFSKYFYKFHFKQSENTKFASREYTQNSLENTDFPGMRKKTENRRKSVLIIRSIVRIILFSFSCSDKYLDL